MKADEGVKKMCIKDDTMKRFFILRGAPASGKSTWIKQNDLSASTVSSDEIRISMFGIGKDQSGRPCIPQRNPGAVWARVRADLEHLMSEGVDDIVLDSCALKSRDIRVYEDMCSDYGYVPVIVDFTGIGREECHRRNKQREEFRRVPEFVIDRFYDRLPDCETPAGYSVVSPDDAAGIIAGSEQL